MNNINERELLPDYYSDLVSHSRRSINNGSPWWLNNWTKIIIISLCFTADFIAILTLLDDLFSENFFLLGLLVATGVLILDGAGMVIAVNFKRYYYNREKLWIPILSVVVFVVLFGLLAAIRFSSMDLGGGEPVSASDMAAAAMSASEELAALEEVEITPAQTVTTTLFMTFLPLITTLFCFLISWMSEDPLLDNIADVEAECLELQQQMALLEAREQELMSEDTYYEQQNLDKSEYGAYQQSRNNERQRLMVRARELLAQHLTANPAELTAVADSSRMVIN